MNFLGNVAAVWNLLILTLAVVALSWFFYAFFLRRIMRKRRIANARDRRLLREAAERSLPRDRR